MSKPSGQLRVVGGQHKGRKMQSPEGQDVRPTTDRVGKACSISWITWF